MAEPVSHTWTCPGCGRRVPRRVDACHCGTTRARAEELVALSPRPAPATGRSRLPVDGRELVATMPPDVKALVAVGALVLAAGLGWLAFGPSPSSRTPAVLGYVDPGAPPPPRPTPRPEPPFALPWWR